MSLSTKNLLQFNEKIESISKEALDATNEARSKVREVCFKNQRKVLEAFISENVGEHHFYGTTGYGFHDSGRETLDRVYARIFNTEAAIVRHSIVSGTHALAAALFGCLRPGDELLCATGDPYDTIKPVMGIDKNWSGGLDEWGISADIAPLNAENMPDVPGIISKITDRTKMIFIQRSCGYNWRPSFSVRTIKEIIQALKQKKPDIIVMVDNCYGEMVEEIEPTDAGADIMGGSLIKNMGGGIAPTGGYIVGRADLIKSTSNVLTCAGIGSEEGATLGHGRLLYQGTFYAPHVVSGALEGIIWASYVLEKLGFDTRPRWTDERTDIIQGIKLGSPKLQEIFCRGIQRACPVNHYATPIAGSLTGYSDPIIMAGGSFIQGSSIELSCDGPLREPYAVYLQGGISFEHVRLGVMNALREMADEKII